MVRPFCLWNNVNNAHSVKTIPALQEQRMKYNCHLNLTDNGIILNAFSKMFKQNLSVNASESGNVHSGSRPHDPGASVVVPANVVVLCVLVKIYFHTRWSRSSVTTDPASISCCCRGKNLARMLAEASVGNNEPSKYLPVKGANHSCCLVA